MLVLIGGDLVPTQSNMDLFNNADTISLLGNKLLSLWDSADIRIFNLETPITNNKKPIAKHGPNFTASIKSLNGIKALNPSLVILANNHILDQGVQGLKSTQNILSENNIPFIGAGENLLEASKPYILKRDKWKIGVYACTEHEFSIAADYTPGANPFDPLESLDHIAGLNNICDYVIVLYHGGKEHYRYPSPYLQKVCRKMIQKGADLVICQHSHCIGCYEEYEGSSIVYGQGNFIFDRFNSEYWKTSLLLKITVNTGLHIEYIPIVKEKNRIRLAAGQIAEDILLSFQHRSQEILRKGFVEEQYIKFAQENIQSYLRSFSGLGKWFSRIDRRFLNGMLLKKIYKLNQLLALQNYIECEAHRELVLAGIKNEIKQFESKCE